MHRLISWIRTVPFLVCFIILMLTADLLLRFFWSRRIYRHLNNLLNRTVLVFLRVFCGVRFKYHLDPQIHDFKKSHLPKVIISNHQSLMDLCMLNLVFEENTLRFIAKRELAKFLPYVSIALRKLPHCLIDRGDRAQALRAIRDYCRVLKNEQSILAIFPEGTRARDGVMKSFKTAGLYTIIEELEEVIVFPVAIDGSYLIAKHKMMPVPAGITVDFHALAPQQITAKQDLKSLLENIENKIKSKIVQQDFAKF